MMEGINVATDSIIEVYRVRVEVLPDGRMTISNLARLLGWTEQYTRNKISKGEGPPTFMEGGRRYAWYDKAVAWRKSRREKVAA